MSRLQYTRKDNQVQAPKTGGVTIKGTKRGQTIQAFNYQRNAWVSVGSISGACYEKGNCAVLKVVRGEYCPSLALTVAELEAARDLGATFLRCITPDKITYAISLNDFEKYGQEYKNAYYGPQIATPLEYFGKVGTSKKRNAVLDNPKGTGAAIFERPQAQQLPMFQPRPHFDEFGNFGGER